MNSIEDIEESLKKSYSYEEYEKLVEDLLKNNKSTTKGGDESLVHYSKLNLHRMQRWDKTFHVRPELTKEIESFPKKRIWLVIAEGWCGDAAHIVPIMHKEAELNSHIHFRIVLREENTDLMNDFLTNGSRSIPKLIVYDSEAKKVENTWGPRPAGATEIFKADRSKQIDFKETVEKLQNWYNNDKGKTTAEELAGLLK